MPVIFVGHVNSDPEEAPPHTLAIALWLPLLLPAPFLALGALLVHTLPYSPVAEAC